MLEKCGRNDQVNNICVCGHEEHSHHFDDEVAIMPEFGNSWCIDCTNSRNSFHNFKIDNLKYLEELYAKRSDPNN